jgi:hypothetical protein
MMPAVPAPLRRYGLLALPLAGCLLLAIAEFTTLWEVRAITVVLDSSTGGSHHGYALLIVAVAAAAMAFGSAIGGSRPAAVALLVLALVALVIVLFVDLPDVQETGLSRDYEQAEANPKIGFYLESAGAVLLLLGAVSVLAFGQRRPTVTASRRAGRATDPSAPA